MSELNPYHKGGQGGGKELTADDRAAIKLQRKKTKEASKLAKQQATKRKEAAKAAAGSGGGGKKKGRGKKGGDSNSNNNSGGGKGGGRIRGDGGAGKTVNGQVRMQSHEQTPHALFSHLTRFEQETSLSLSVGFSKDEIHPAVLRLGLQYANGNIVGSNARCVALLNALKEFIRDYTTPSDKALSRDMSLKLKPIVRFLESCRPKSISMGNAIRYVKAKVSKVPMTTSEADAKAQLIEDIDRFLRLRIEMAGAVIAQYGAERIQNGDVIMTHAKSTSVEMVFKTAHDAGKTFSVIVVDSRPKLEGRVLLERLVAYGIKCTYVLISAVGYMMQEVSKVFVGASAMLANGTALSRCGAALIGMMAKANNVPFIVCCEMYKLHERVQVDAITCNELGDPDELIIGGEDGKYGNALADWRDNAKLNVRNLTYDLIPVPFIACVITEIGVLPCTSVPVIVREYRDVLQC